MKNFIIKSFEFMGVGKRPEDLRFFCDDIDAFIGDSSNEKSELFRLNIVSTKWLENAIDEQSEGLYLRFCLIMGYYDEAFIRQHLGGIVKECNFNDDEKIFDCIAHFLKHETEDWLYKEKQPGKFFLNNFFLQKTSEALNDLESFNEEIYVCIKQEEGNSKFLFKTRIISPLWINKSVEECVYFKHCIVTKYYDEKVIKQHLENVVKRCNKEGVEKAFDCLTYYLEYVEQINNKIA